MDIWIHLPQPTEVLITGGDCDFSLSKILQLIEKKNATNTDNTVSGIAINNRVYYTKSFK